MPTYLLWDHDGVLVNTEPCFLAATREALALLGVNVDRDMYLRYGLEGRDWWQDAADLGASQETIRRARAARDERYHELIARDGVEIDGVLETLAELKAHYRMAIVTMAKRADFDRIHKSGTIPGYFEFSITSNDCQRGKPHPEPYLRALERFGAKPEEALAIEDTAHGLAAAVAAGIRCVIIRSEFIGEQAFPGAWKILDSVTELPKALGHEGTGNREQAGQG